MDGTSARPNTGPFVSEDEALAFVVDRLVETLSPLQVWLFGSRARGDHRPDSDLDILIVTDLDAPASEDDYERVYAPLVGNGIGVVVVPCRIDDLEIHLERGHGMVHDIVARGILLHDRACPENDPFQATVKPGGKQP